MASTPQFIGTPQVWPASLSTANTGRDGTGTLVTLVTGAATPGTRIDKIRVCAAGTTTAGVVRVFHDDSTTKRLVAEILVGAITPSTSVKTFEAELTFQDGFVLKDATHMLKISTHNAENFNVFAHGGNM